MKKKARETVAKRLRDDMHKINNQLLQNRYAMRKLVDAQTLLKRERAVLHELIQLCECERK